jgi:hypothetical protein
MGRRAGARGGLMERRKKVILNLYFYPIRSREEADYVCMYDTARSGLAGPRYGPSSSHTSVASPDNPD